MAIFAPALMRILGETFAPGANVLVVLCIGSIVTFMAGNIHSLLIMSGRSGWAAVNKIVVLSLNVVGNLIFIPRGGMVAAAVVWAVCMVLDAAMATVQVSRFIGVTPKLSEVVKPILVVGASAVIPGGCIAWVLGRDSFVATVAAPPFRSWFCLRLLAFPRSPASDGTWVPREEPTGLTTGRVRRL